MKKTIPFLITVFVALCITFGVLYKHDDRNPPTINFPTAEIVYNGDNSVLLQGVTATDNKDGDVTNTLVIDSISTKEGQNTVLVTYAAKDKNQNIACVTREFKYEPIVETPASTEPEDEDDVDDENIDDEDLDDDDEEYSSSSSSNSSSSSSSSQKKTTSSDSGVVNVKNSSSKAQNQYLKYND